MPLNKQPVASSSYRNNRLSVPIDEDTPLVPSGPLKLPIRPGAPSDGLILALPNTWGGREREITEFRMFLFLSLSSSLFLVTKKTHGGLLVPLAPSSERRIGEGGRSHTESLSPLHACLRHAAATVENRPFRWWLQS